MTLLDFLEECSELYDQYGLQGARIMVENAMRGLFVRAFAMREAFKNADSVLDEELDLLVILDACRLDLMEEYSSSQVNARKSYASSSQDWLQRTFFDCNVALSERLSMSLSLLRDPYQNQLIAETMELREVNEVAYITGNPQSSMLPTDDFYHIEELWRGDWDRSQGFIPPRPITDTTIEFLREHSPGLTIVHYMQPHEPFRSIDLPNNTIWAGLQRGEISFEEVWDGYVDNLEWVMNDVGILLENVDAQNVAISADHGNSLGEFGFYGHRPYLPLEGMRLVPWIETTAKDTRSHFPTHCSTNKEHNAEELLEDLGYI